MTSAHVTTRAAAGRGAPRRPDRGGEGASEGSISPAERTRSPWWRVQRRNTARTSRSRDGSVARVARSLVELDPEHERLLRGGDRLIVVAPRGGEGAAASVAPASRDLGVMLPYSLLHHRPMSDVRAPLGVTSGNVSDEPIAYRDEDALIGLAPIADLFLVHDRPVETRTDDSVVRTAAVPGRRERSVLRRRAGSPEPARASGAAAAACGAEPRARSAGSGGAQGSGSTSAT